MSKENTNVQAGEQGDAPKLDPNMEVKTDNIEETPDETPVVDESWKERVKEEIAFVEPRVIKLDEALRDGKMPKEARKINKDQLMYMSGYLNCLKTKLEL